MKQIQDTRWVKMVKVFEGTDDEYYMDGILKSNLDDAKKAVREDWDMILLVDGYEGTGKSTMAMHIAKYCDPTFNVDKVVFTPRQFREKVISAKEYTAVVYDEAYTGLASRGAMSQVNKALVSMLAEIRQKNLIILIVMPTFFDLDRYVALWRSRALIHVYSKGFRRGYFTFFSVEKKKELYINGKKFYSYNKPKCVFRGRFTKHYPINKEEYLKKKKGALTTRERQKAELAKKKEIEAMLFDRVMQVGDDVKHNAKMAVLQMLPTTYYRKRKEWLDKQEEDAI